MSGNCGTDVAGTREQHQDIFGNARLMEELHSFEGNQRRLRCRLGDNGIAGNQGRRDLTEEDGEREVPRRDAGKDAAAAPGETVELTGRAGHDFGFTELLAGLNRIVAAEVDSLADFGHAVIQRLAGLERQKREQPVAILFEKVGELV